MAINIEEIGGAISETSGGFSHTEIYVAKTIDFETLTEPLKREGDDAATTLEELVTINATHVFKTDKGFTKIKAIRESVGLETNQIGDVNKSPNQENKLTIQLLGSDPKLLGYKRWLKGEDLIVLVPEFGTGNFRQIGSAKFAAKAMEMSSKIEQNVEGENSITVVFQDKQLYDAPIYKGDITKQPTV